MKLSSIPELDRSRKRRIRIAIIVITSLYIFGQFFSSRIFYEKNFEVVADGKHFCYQYQTTEEELLGELNEKSNIDFEVSEKVLTPILSEILDVPVPLFDLKACFSYSVRFDEKERAELPFIAWFDNKIVNRNKPECMYLPSTHSGVVNIGLGLRHVCTDQQSELVERGHKSGGSIEATISTQPKHPLLLPIFVLLTVSALTVSSIAVLKKAFS